MPKQQRPDACPTNITGTPIVLGLSDGQTTNPDERIQLTRSVELENEFFLLEEWALVDASTQNIKLAASSSARMEKTYLESLNLRTDQLQGSVKFLIVHYPEHPHNARHIELPDLAFDERRMEPGAKSLWVRADFAASAAEPRVEILAAEGDARLPLEAELASRLKLKFKTDKRHRVIGFANILIDADGHPRIASEFHYLAVCCCEEWPYCPV